MRIDPEQTVARIGIDDPRSLVLFDRFGLDYCCGGTRTLRQACEAAGVDLATLQRELEALSESASTGERDWGAATMTELADHIEHTHHVFVRETFARLAVLVPKVAGHHGAAHPELLQLEKTVRRLAEEMHDHMIREDRVLFPWLRRLDRKSEIHTGPPWSVRRPIDCMMHDHDEVGKMLREIRGLTDNFTPPPGACASFRVMVSLLAELERDTHLHVHKENNILFPAGVRAEAAEMERRGAIQGSTAGVVPGCT